MTLYEIFAIGLGVTVLASIGYALWRMANNPN